MTTRTLTQDVFLNGAPTATAQDTLAGLVSEQGFGSVRVATAVNGEFVPERLRAVTPLKAGDRIEILSARQGG